MAFPASSLALSSAYGSIKSKALSIKTQATSLRDASAEGPISADRIIRFATDMDRVRNELAIAAATPGLAAHAQAQEGNPTLDIVAEYNAMIAQLNATTAWISNNLPKDANGYNLVLQIGTSGALLWRTFDSTATAGLRSALDQLIASIA